MSVLKAGIARAVITPEIGIPLVGFAGRGPAKGVHDDLTATALALECGEERAVLIAVDLLSISDGLAGEVRSEVERRTGVPVARVLLCASHTHYGLATDPSSADPNVTAYTANLIHLLADAAQSSLTSLQPVRAGFGVGECAIGINRRERRPDGEIVLGQNPDGPCDRSVGVARLDTFDGRPLAVLINATCHGVSAAHRMRWISADFVGVMQAQVEQTTGATCMFLQGAAGNVNAIEMRHSFEPAHRLGAMLGQEALRVMQDIETASQPILRHASERVGLTAMTFPSLDVAEQETAELRQAAAELRERDADTGAQWWANRRLGDAERKLQSIRSGVPLPPVMAELNVLRMGDAAIVTAPAEVFNETGVEIKRRSPFPATCFAGYTNGSIGYVPTPPAYAEGGYEVTHLCAVAPEATGMLIDRSLALLGRVSSSGGPA